MRKHEKIEEWMSNRDKRRIAHRALFWCDGCDCDLVPPGGKCKTCGHRHDYVKRNKK